MATVDYDDFLDQQLQDLEFAAGYLTACLDEGPEVFLLGIRNLARAQGGMKALSDSTELNRENLYDMLSKQGNPRLSSLTTVLGALGLEFDIRPRNRAAGK